MRRGRGSGLENGGSENDEFQLLITTRNKSLVESSIKGTGVTVTYHGCHYDTRGPHVRVVDVTDL